MGGAAPSPAAPDVVVVGRVGAAIAIEEDRTVFAESVLVRPRPIRFDGRGRDRERHEPQDGWLEDALDALQANALTLEYEPISKDSSREYLSMRLHCLREELEGGKPHLQVEIEFVGVPDRASHHSRPLPIPAQRIRQPHLLRRMAVGLEQPGARDQDAGAPRARGGDVQAVEAEEELEPARAPRRLSSSPSSR